MRLMYDNLLSDATLSASSVNANYPAANLVHIWKKKYFLASAAYTEVTATLAASSTITAICLAYHNLSEAEAELYDDGDVLLDTWTLSVDYDTDVTYGSQEDVKKIIFNLTSADTVRVGQLFAGEYISASKDATQDIPLMSNDAISFSLDMQPGGRSGSVTRGANITIPTLTATERAEMEAAYIDCGLITPFYLDLWNSSHSSFEPLYGVFASQLSVTHLEEGDTVAFDFQETN
jgi:hypothetical protein